ncbi:MAG: hypothetical protein E5Y10_35370, partial [Mesorhizobium sp.]|uniref:hypothetical protein n=1 Tax=Mesorhizobium sp. TaxID=1871066 RepID=UPI0012122FD1
DLRQTYVRVGKLALIKHQRYAHAKQMGWMPAFSDGIAMCQVCGVSATQREAGIHGKGYHHWVDLAKNVFVRPASRVSFCFTGGDIA